MPSGFSKKNSTPFKVHETAEDWIETRAVGRNCGNRFQVENRVNSASNPERVKLKSLNLEIVPS